VTTSIALPIDVRSDLKCERLLMTAPYLRSRSLFWLVKMTCHSSNKLQYVRNESVRYLRTFKSIDDVAIIRPTFVPEEAETKLRQSRSIIRTPLSEFDSGELTAHKLASQSLKSIET
jgi:hypothetical protein